MKLLPLLFLIALLNTGAAAQDTFVKQFAGSGSTQVRILPTADLGWVVCELDSLKLYKFNACGVAQWSKRIHIPLSGWNSNDLVQTPTGGFAFLSRTKIAGEAYASVIVSLDQQGNVMWARTYEDPDFAQYPYNLNFDQQGNFILQLNIDRVNTSGNFHNLICKISPAGDLLWAKQYQHGPIWGKSITTSDNGILRRVGSTFLKTDANGEPQWATVISSPTYNYFAPVEVADGYIFTGYNTSDHRITFMKIDKQGNLLWGHRKELSAVGTPPNLRSKPNGNFAAVFNHTILGKTYATVLEFDKGLNIVQQSALANPGSKTLTGLDLSFAPDGSTLITGKVSGSNTQLFFARLDEQYKAGCDTSVAIGVTAAPVTSLPLASSVSTHTLQAVSQSYSVTSLPVSAAAALCTTAPEQVLGLPADTLLCSGGSVTLQAAANPLFDSYLWSTGETSASITVSQPGVYWLKASNSCRAESVLDSVRVAVGEFPEVTVPTDLEICATEPLLLSFSVPDATYLWPDNSTGNTFAVQQPGVYPVRISWHGCTRTFSTEVGNCEQVVMPNVFTPNSDLKNDRFAPTVLQGVTAARLRIYNRWGQQIHQTENLADLSWSGNPNSTSSPVGLYFWHLQYTTFLNQQKELKGTVELLAR